MKPFLETLQQNPQPFGPYKGDVCCLLRHCLSDLSFPLILGLILRFHEAI